MAAAKQKVNAKDNARLMAIKAMLDGNKGKFFTVTALRKTPKKKEDGSVEHFMTLTGRQEVKAHLKGGESTIKHKEDLISLYVIDGEKSGYRCFSGYNVLNMSVGGSKLEFNREDVMEMANKEF